MWVRVIYSQYPKMKKNSILQGYAGFFSICVHHVKRPALFAFGNQGLLRGVEYGDPLDQKAVAPLQGDDKTAAFTPHLVGYLAQPGVAIVNRIVM
jgi:hypothetical protein